MKKLLSTLGASLLAILAIILVVTLVAPGRGVPAANSKDSAGRNSAGRNSAGGVVLVADRTGTTRAGTIAETVRGAGEAPVVFQFDTWPDVWGSPDGNLNRGGDFHGDFHGSSWKYQTNWRDGGEWTQGPLAVVLIRRDGRVRRLKTFVGEHWRRHVDDPIDLGHVSADEAARYLLGLANSASDEEVGSDAIVAAVFIRDADIWDELFGIARNESRSEEIRSSALFWIGQEAGEREAAGLADVAEDDGDAEIRDAAVFALSQRPDSESIPALKRLATTSRHPGVRRSALFWLAQHDDPSVIDFFEELLAGD